MRSLTSLRDGTQVTVRTASTDDALGVLLLLDDIARERRWLLNTRAYWGVAEQRRWLEKVEQNDGTTLVAESADGDIIAWAELGRPATELTRHTATLGMGVAAAYRRLGLGRWMLELLVDEARSLGIRRIELQARSNNTSAIRLYESMGWRHEGRGERAFLLDGQYEDRIEMGLWLGEDAPPG